MKVRCGFVSNSSTSSFCIYGIMLEDKHVEKIKEKIKILDPKNNDEDDEWYVLSEELENYFCKNEIGLEFHSMMGEYFYIGRSWKYIKDNETGLEFKKSIENTIKELLGEELKCSTHSEAWRD